MESKIGYIYVLTSPSGKHYIGQSWNVTHRFSSYKCLGKGCHEQPKLYNALKKYGPENFEFYIISSANTQEDLDKKECYWIGMYNAQNDSYGYNIKDGGNYGRHSEETKEKMKKYVLDHPYKHTIESKRKISENNRKRVITDTHKQNLRKGLIGKKRPKSVCEKISIGKRKYNFSSSHKENIRKRKSIYWYRIFTPEKIEIISNNLNKFCIDHNLNNGHMHQVSIGKEQHHKGYTVTKIPNQMAG